MLKNKKYHDLQKEARSFFLLLLAGVVSLPVVGKQKNPTFRVLDLQSEYQVNPIGIDVSPRLSWRVQSNERGFSQTAYQVIVASSLNKLNVDSADVWNSGKTVSSQSLGISIYNNKVLQSRQRYYWKVRVWKNAREVSDWSFPAFFEMGLYVVKQKCTTANIVIYSDISLFYYQKFFC